MDKYWTEFSLVHATLSRSTNDEKRHHGLHLDQLMKSYKKISYLTIFLAERKMLHGGHYSVKNGLYGNASDHFELTLLLR